jgi:exodeoxyribonuclease VII large subunit
VLTDPARLVRDRQRRADDLAMRLARAVRRQAAGARQRVARATRALRPEALRAGLKASDQRLGALRHGLARAARGELARRRHAIESLAGRLDSLSPLGVLARGYAICTLETGRTLRRAGEVAVGATVRVRLAEGSLGCRVEDRAHEARPAAAGGASGV